jgi:hypothetical protein
MSRARLNLAFVGLAFVGLAALGCDESRAPFDLDGLVEPATECVTVVHESLDLGGPLHEFAGDGLGSPGGWGVVSLEDALFVVRLPASADEPPTKEVSLGLPDEYAELVSLRIGLDGELWVLIESDTVSLRRMLPGVGEVVRNDSLGYFPAYDDNGGCPTDHARSLLLIEGRPYVLALPDCADGPGLSIHLLALDRETLEYLNAWQLAFDPCDGFVDPVQCALIHAYTLESIGAPGSAPHATLERVAVAFTQVRAFSGLFDGVLRLADVSMLDMRMTDGGPQARLVSYREVWTDVLPFSVGPVEVTRDPYSTQLHVRNQLLDDDAVMVRLDTIAEQYSLLSRSEDLPLEGRGRLVQLADSGAMLEVRDGQLRAAGLRDWPTWTTQVLLELPDLVDLEVVGIGQLLLRREQSPPRVVHLTCVK